MATDTDGCEILRLRAAALIDPARQIARKVRRARGSVMCRAYSSPAPSQPLPAFIGPAAPKVIPNILLIHRQIPLCANRNLGQLGDVPGSDGPETERSFKGANR